MTRDLYAILGVARDADYNTIRAAYRNAAKTAHPDLGGSAEEFEALKEAFDCLSDEVRRANYDRTGYYTRGKEADTLDAKALDKLRSTIVGIVNLIRKSEKTENEQFSMIFDGHLIDSIEWQLNKWLEEDRFRLKGFENEAAIYISLAQHFEGIGGSPNRISPLMQTNAKFSQEKAEGIELEIKIKERAIKILLDHGFRHPDLIESAQQTADYGASDDIDYTGFF